MKCIVHEPLSVASGSESLKVTYLSGLADIRLLGSDTHLLFEDTPDSELHITQRFTGILIPLVCDDVYVVHDKHCTVQSLDHKHFRLNIGKFKSLNFN